MVLPRLYAIVDAEVCRGRGVPVEVVARELAEARVGLVQYRDKNGNPEEVLRAAEMVRLAFGQAGKAMLIMNDRADLAVLAGFDGVHVGQGDLSVEDARVVAGTRSPRGFVVGLSTHTEEQVSAGESGGADYVAIGPVFSTSTKADAAAVVGLEGVRRARALTKKPLVAIGGITRANARSVIEAGADSVAVISGLFGAGERVRDVAREFLAELTRGGSK